MGYCKPFKRGVSWRSQNFADNPNNGTNGAGGHTGNDDAAPIGSEVHAAGDGVIEYAGTFDDTYADNLLWLIDFGGNILVLNCGDNEPTFVYAHLSTFRVKPGDRVRKGQVIALSGNTGTRTTGPHCHNEAIAPGYVLNAPTLGRVNPDLYMTEWPDDYAGIAAMGGTITPLEEDDMGHVETISDEAAVKIADALLRRKAPSGAMLLEVVESFAAVMDHVIQATTEAVLNTPIPDVRTGGTTTLATEVGWAGANAQSIRDGVKTIDRAGFDPDKFNAQVQASVKDALSGLTVTLKAGE